MFLTQYINKMLPNTTETPQNNYLAKTLVGKCPKQQPAKTNRAQILARAQQIDGRKLAKRNYKNPCGEKRETDKEKLKTNKNTNNELNSKKPYGEKLHANKHELKQQLGAQAGTHQLTMQTSAHGKAAKKTTNRGKITNSTERCTRAYGYVDERPAGSI